MARADRSHAILAGDPGARSRCPDGTPVGSGGRGRPDDVPVIELVRPTAFFARLGRDPKIGFGEAYMAGDWRPRPGTDLGRRCCPFAARLTTLPCPSRCSGCAPWSSERLPHAQRNTLDGLAAQHRGPLRPDQRPVRGVPRPDADLLLGPVRRRAPLVRADPRGGAAPQDRRRPRPRRRRRRARRVLEIGTGWGDARHPGRRARRAGHHAHAVRRAGRPRPAAGRRGRAGRPGRHPAAGLPRGRRAATTRSSASR